MYYKLVNFCEFDKFAEKSYCAIHGVDASLNLGDITKVDETKLPDFKMICGGSPCQDFSVAGKRKGAAWICRDCQHEYNPLTVHYTKRDKCPVCGSENLDKTRSSLLVEWLRVIRKKLPDFGIYENVKNIVGKEFKPTFDLFIKELQEYGYNTYYKVLNAKDFGIPQNRERIYLIIIKQKLDNGLFRFPQPFPLKKEIKDMLNEKVQQKYYLSAEQISKFQNSSFNQEKARLQEKNYTDTLLSMDWKAPKCVPVKNDDAVRDRIQIAGKINSSQDGIVVDTREISKALTDGNFNQPKIVEHEIKQVMQIYPNSGNPQAGRVYSMDSISPSIDTCTGGNRMPKVMETVICASRGRNPENPSDRTAGVPTEQRLEINAKGISNTITSVQKDNYVLEPNVLTPKRTEYGKKYEEGEIKERFFRQAINTFENSNAEYGDTIDAFNERFNKSGCSPTLTTRPEGFKTAILPVTRESKIRKLMPLECFRLMGFSDEEFFCAMLGSWKAAKVLIESYGDDCLKMMVEADKYQEVSNTQLYKQAGNSIVVDVLYYIFLELYNVMPYLFENLTLSSYFSGIGAFESALDRLYTYINHEERHRKEGGEN